MHNRSPVSISTTINNVSEIISLRSWNFGDGGSSSSGNPTYSYSTANSYNVRQILISNNSCRDTTFKSVTVYSQPVSGFSVNDTALCFRNHKFIFTNSGNISSGTFNTRWFFGNGDSSQVNSPNYTYAGF